MDDTSECVCVCDSFAHDRRIGVAKLPVGRHHLKIDLDVEAQTQHD